MALVRYENKLMTGQLIDHPEDREGRLPPVWFKCSRTDSMYPYRSIQILSNEEALAMISDKMDRIIAYQLQGKPKVEED